MTKRFCRRREPPEAKKHPAMPVECYPLKVTKKVKEAPGAYSFCFSPPAAAAQKFLFRAGQFLTFRFQIEGKEYARSYSISSCPFLDEPLQTAVKKIPGGRVSSYMADHLQEGDTVMSQPPMGEFFSPPKSLKPKDYVFFGAGIGITPLLSILKTVLETSLCRRALLACSSRSAEDIIYRKELELLEKKHSDHLEIRHVLSQKEGRLDPEKLAGMLRPANLKGAMFYLCGPAAYMGMIQKELRGMSVPPESIRTEDFKTIPVRGPKPDKNSVFFEAGAFEEGEPESLLAVLDGAEMAIPINREKPLMEQLLDKGHAPPFSCASGSCMTCMAKLQEGKIFQPDEGVLDEENIRAGEFLSCQAFPLSKKVKFSYDDV